MAGLVTLFMGHRGVGKSSLLRELRDYGRHHGLDWSCLDLDDEIARREGCTVSGIFSRGEAAFRRLEEAVLSDLVRSAERKTFISVGAGFEGQLPAGVHVVWIRRTTDAAGRVFLDRPRLNAELSFPLDEYGKRFVLRNRRYAEWANEQLILPEGLESGASAFFDGHPLHLPFALTVLPENLLVWSEFWNKRRFWGLRYVELRDDLLSAAEIASLLLEIPREQVLLSHRKTQERKMFPANIRRDWALELGPPPDQPYILSLHERGGPLSEDFKRLGSYPCAIEKLAVRIRDFSELREGHEWWLKAPERRAFLPASENGRWRWYRSLFGPRMPVHFIREGDGSAPDQPFLLQALLQKKFDGRFGAVLGTPVEHSRTPMEHRLTSPFPVVAVDIQEDEFDEALVFLRELGLTAAAVTSPLKLRARTLATDLTEEVRVTGSANTLRFNGRDVYAHNTDLLALRRLQEEIPARSVWLWGGGGVKSAVQSVWPHVKAISARKGTPDEGQPDLLIWAVGRSREFAWPSERIRPKQILDLNYTADSPGLEWAIMHGIPYQSGLRMFKLQAEYQRQFWREGGSL
jgi:shikimate 5-dehydrogenase/shikimate kinase